MDIIFASHNQNKIKEIRSLAPSHITITSLLDLEWLEEIEETGATFLENARIKAHAVWERYRKPVFAGDSGLEIDVLDGAPGVYSARYAGPNRDFPKAMKQILDEMKDVNVEGRGAQFQTVFVYLDEHGAEHIFRGIVKGSISEEIVGTSAFGYDNIFVPSEYPHHTFGQITPVEKGAISHRGKAARALIHFLNI